MGKLGGFAAAGLIALALGVSSSAAPRSPSTPLKPVLHFAGASVYDAAGKQWVRHRYVVRNWARFPADLFRAAPDLPPCGRNANAARTWVDLYESSGKRLYGFCALGKPADLQCLWFATELDAPPPETIYIVLNDRQTGKSYRSNIARAGPAHPTEAATAATEAAAAKADCLRP